MKKKLKLVSLFALGLILFMACEKDTPPPTVSFIYTVDGSKVTFTAEATNFTKFEWDFGDGSYISTIHNPTHSYSEYGKEYTVSLTIIGEGGIVTETKTVKIPEKTKMQLLTGGTDASSSKKWRISVSAPHFLITAATVNFLPVVEDYPGGILAAVGLGQAYSDEFVFKGDGTLTINPKGGGIFAGYVYCLATATPIANNPAAAGAGLAYASPFTTPAGATFKINEGKDFTIPTAIDGENIVNVTYNNVMTLSFTNNGFLGIKDFVSECIIQELTDTKMVAALFVSTNYPNAIGVPNLALIITFEVAP